MKPVCLYRFLQTVNARSGGSAARYTTVKRMPGASRIKGCWGKAVPNHFTQKYSDRFTLDKVCSLCTSQFSKGPKKFQFGPRRKVPMTMSEIHRIRKPNMNVPTASGRSLSV